MDVTIIEVMPLGDVGDDRLDQYLPLSMVRARLVSAFRSKTWITGPVDRPAMSASTRPADGSASSRR